ncbi:hypothetical protein SDRG_08088 [Saprolegnia diclina VS20]|uniref:GOLD domain-containing protein n=1 Tax=Saprolegnia diclina (strain VS20) TaxID=1156394 RepID=T0QKJ1_SAPDV|nr:hypothetical protein SDRG_08088 [Saprolegnia diclina VS20]EQC34315.1 hypothetical protein SDRG_08088 [Saprolegnia diclina VS20]|eukprot:XP_008612177.1 hypothetical protein SDRG_08088 [Saprolegnia diclina VS20]
MLTRAVVVAVAWLALAVEAGSRFLFKLDTSATTSSPECYYELLDARATQNRLLFRFELVEAGTPDAVDAFIQTPTGRLAKQWTFRKAGHVAIQVRESGLYRFCFVHPGSGSSEKTVVYAFDFLLAGTRTFTVYPSRADTLGAVASSSLTAVRTRTDHESVGYMRFSLSGVSPSIVDLKTRVYLSLSVKATDVSELQLATIPLSAVQHRHWQSHLDGVARDHVVACAAGGSVVFDITDLATDAIKHGQATLSLAVFSPSVGTAELHSMSQVAADHWPLVTFEDVGASLWIEMLQFRQRVWDLKGKIGSIVQHERTSRNAAESAHARFVVVALLGNVVLVSMALTQVYYVRQWLAC